MADNEDRGLPSNLDDLIEDLGSGATAGGLAQDLFNLLVTQGTKLPLDELGAGGKLLGGLSSAFAVLGIATGGIQAIDEGVEWWGSGSSEDLYGAADGYTTAALSSVALATAGIPGVNVVTAGAAAVWGVGTLINGAVSDRPLTQNLIDYASPVGLVYNGVTGGQLSEDINDLAVGAKDTVVDTVSDAGGFLKDAGGSALDKLGF